jgi:addiction module HigA family antidote
MVERIRTILSFLNAAGSVEDMGQPSFKLHALKGELKGSGQSRSAPTGASFFASRTATHLTSTFWTIIEGADMAMKNPAHPGSLIRDNIDELGLSIADAAKGLDVTRQQLYKVVKGESAVTPEMAVRLEKAFGGSADTWLRMQMNFDLARAREREINVTRLKPKAA